MRTLAMLECHGHVAKDQKGLLATKHGAMFIPIHIRNISRVLYTKSPWWDTTAIRYPNDTK